MSLPQSNKIDCFIQYTQTDRKNSCWVYLYNNSEFKPLKKAIEKLSDKKWIDLVNFIQTVKINLGVTLEKNKAKCQKIHFANGIRTHDLIYESYEDKKEHSVQIFTKLKKIMI